MEAGTGQDRVGLGPLSSPGVTSLEQPIARFPPGAAFGSDGQEETASPLRPWSHWYGSGQVYPCPHPGG